MHYLFFDTETTGVDAQVDHILTAYFGIYGADFQLLDELYLQLKPEDISVLDPHSQAFAVNGIDLRKHLEDPLTVSYAEGRKKLTEMLTRHKIAGKKRSYRPCGHNVDFDVKFVNERLLDRETWGKIVHYNTLDTLRIATFLQDAGFLPVELGKLESFVKYFNIPMGETHHAREDTRMTVDVYKALRNLLISQKKTLGGVTSGNSLLDIIES